jgi:hypothetical protein
VAHLGVDVAAADDDEVLDAARDEELALPHEALVARLQVHAARLVALDPPVVGLLGALVVEEVTLIRPTHIRRMSHIHSELARA